MNLVIPLHPWNGQDVELRFALRSFAKFMPYDDLTIVGFKPEWLKNVNHLPFRDDPQPKYREANIYLKLQYYIQKSDGMRNDFIFANDDHFLLTEFNTIPPQKGSISDTLHSRRDGDPYIKTIENTIEILGPKALNYDAHYPMVMTPEAFQKVFIGSDPMKPNVQFSRPYGFLLKSIYASCFRLTGRFTEDYKINAAANDPKFLLDTLQGKEYFSTSDFAMNEAMIKALIELYPEPSKHE